MWGGGASAGLYADLTERWRRLLASASYLRYALGDRSDDMRWSVGNGIPSHRTGLFGWNTAIAITTTTYSSPMQAFLRTPAAGKNPQEWEEIA